MINALLNGIMNMIIGLVGVLLKPIDLLIEQFLPDLGNAMNMFSGMLNYIGDFLVWAVSWLGLNFTVRGLIVAYYTFVLTVPLLVATIKLALKWYDKLKP